MAIERWFGAWDPFRELEDLQRRIGRMVDDRGRFPFTDWFSGAGEYPPVNVYTTDDQVVVAAEIPGIAKEDVDLSIAGDTLTLNVKREPAENEEACFRRERLRGEFRRLISLPEPVEAEKAAAEYKQGILTITIPRREEFKPRKIEVNAGQ